MARGAPTGPYMIYEGPIPEVVKARLAKAAEARAEAGPGAEPDEAAGPGAALFAVLAVTLAVGLGLGLWLRPTVDRALHANPAPVLAQAAPTALRPEVDTSAIPGAEEIPASAPQPVARAEALTPAPASLRSMPPAKVRPAVVKVSASTPAAKTTKTSGDPCMASASRADQLICADPVLAAADLDLGRAAERAAEAGGRPDALDWLVTRESAARRSPQALAEAYQRRIAELRSLADPPH